uniref:Mucin-5AC n=1 Tax=Anopheles atroparvus TaxID=41427 RepID=A0A182J6J4_ANOAO
MREKRRSIASTGALLVALVVAGCFPLAYAGERWSRQLTEFTGGPVTGNDWIPLSRPGSERQSGARVLNYFAPQSSFLDSTAQPQQHHFTFLNHQFPQSNRFLLQQPPAQQELLEQNQPFQLGNFRSAAPPFVGQTIQHPPPPPPPPPPSSNNPFEQQFLSKSPLSEALIQEDNKPPQQSGSLHDQQSFSYQHIRQPELEQPQTVNHAPNGGAVSQEEVQLLYVPVETLYNQNQKPETNRFNSLPQPVSPSLINDFYTSAAITTTTPKPPRTSAATFPPPSSRFPPSSSSEGTVSRSSSTSTSSSPKPKPNQPPLALFLYNDAPRSGKLTTSEALGGLKNINEIAVLDSVGKNSPKVFIGPSGLAPPKSYSRFDLPYLSSVDLTSSRANRKIEDLPFFVAPLSYKTPSGYAKISLPPPHVGSIVVRQSSGSGNSLDNGPFYTRPTAQSNVQYYTPSTLNFADGTTTKAPSITLGSSGKPIYDADHYTSPTGKPPPTSDRSVSQYNSGFNGPPPSRHAVNEEYFNLAKTRKPTTSPPTTPSYPVRSYGSTRQFDFKPMPEQKIPPSFYPIEEDEPEPVTTTTFGTTPTTTTERPTTAQLHFEAERMRTHFREENFRSRRPYQHQQQTTAASPNDASEASHVDRGHFVHKFKLVDSDLFFREFEQKSKFYEREPKYESPSFPTTVGTTGASYQNKYRYETDSSFNESPRYSVEVITTSEPTTITADPSQGTTGQQQFSIPSELPPISANLPGLVNALMDDQWPLKTADRQATPATVPTSTGNTRTPHFRKQLHRTTTQDSYDAEQATTTRRPLQRGRRPHPSRTTIAPPTGDGAFNEQPASSTRTPNSRSRSRYVPNNEERGSSRGRSRSRSTTPRSQLKEVENLDYQRDVLKQNYPVIRPQSQSLPVTTTPAPTTASATTLSFREVYEDQTERLLATTLAASDTPQEIDPQTQTRKYSEYYEPEAVVTTVLPPQTTNYFVPSNAGRAQQQDDHTGRVQEEYVRSQEVIPLARDPEQSVIPLRSQPSVTEASPQSQPPAQYQPVTESEEKLTTAYGQPIDETMEIKKVEITPRPRRPGLVSRQRDSQQNYYTRTTTEPTTTVRTTTPEPSAVGSRTSGRRPAFVRRPSRLYATTTVAPAPTTTTGNGYDQQQPTQGTYTVRTKNRQDILRGRTRRPTTTTEPTAAATTASPEAPVTRAFGRGNSLRRISPTARSRQQEQTVAPTTQQPAPPSSSGPRFRIRERTRFNLQPQESQWSTKLNQNSFQPVLKTDARGVEDHEQENVSTEPEPEIVTAAREAEMYFMNVSSNYGQKEGNQQEAHAEDSTENSVPSFADLLNDVMKDFIDDNSQKKPAADSSDEKKRPSEVEQRRPVNFRNNFLRKRGRSKVVDSFETAESQNINHATQVYNVHAQHYGESVKNIDHAVLSGKNVPLRNSGKLQHEQHPEDQENTAQEEATLAPQADEEARHEAETEETGTEDLVTVLPVVEASSTTVEPTARSERTTSKPTEEAPTLASLEQTSTNSPQQQEPTEATTLAANTIEPAFEEDLTNASEEKEDAPQAPAATSSFDAVKKMVSDYYKVVENDSETEEVVDGDEPVIETDDVADDDGDYFHATGDPLAENDELAPTTDMTQSETLLVPVTANPPAVNPMGSLVIPTSVSNGITHETEICYRGRCIKTEDDKRKRKDKLN